MFKSPSGIRTARSTRQDGDKDVDTDTWNREGGLIALESQIRGEEPGASSMSNVKRRDEDEEAKRRRRQRFEEDCRYVMAVLNSKRPIPSSRRFEKSLARVQTSLLALAHVFLRNQRNPSRRHDLANEAAAIWHRNMLAKGFKSYLAQPGDRRFTPYATRSLHNICVSLQRRDRGGSVSLIDEPPDQSGDPCRAAELRELEQECGRAVATLPDELRECVRLIYWEGLSGREVAERMGKNSRTVATWHSRARQRLARHFRQKADCARRRSHL
jgi:RNA polymerase sigma factor (sigma-70 family)